MAEFSAKDVKALRDATGAGMMDCEAALEETGGDKDAAIRLLREKGIAEASKRTGRAAGRGHRVRIHAQARPELPAEAGRPAGAQLRDRTSSPRPSSSRGSPRTSRCTSRSPTRSGSSASRCRRTSSTRSLRSTRSRPRTPASPRTSSRRSCQGKLESFYKEHVLLDQEWIQDKIQVDHRSDRRGPVDDGRERLDRQVLSYPGRRERRLAVHDRRHPGSGEVQAGSPQAFR